MSATTGSIGQKLLVKVSVLMINCMQLNYLLSWSTFSFLYMHSCTNSSVFQTLRDDANVLFEIIKPFSSSY